MSFSLPIPNTWPPLSPHRVARGARSLGRAAPPRPCNLGETSRGHLTRANARKGFGAALPRLPSFGGSKSKVPAGGVTPTEPIELGIPAELERLWINARDEWRQRCIEQPVLLPAHGAQVHVVPVGADLPGDAALIRDVVAAVRPDAIALESPPQHLKSYTSIAKALEPQLAQLLATDPRVGPAASRSCFSARQREELQAALLGACRGASLKPDPDQLVHMFRLGSVPFVEWLAPAHLVRTSGAAAASATSSWRPSSLLPSPPAATAAGGAASGGAQQQPMLLLSCGLDREARAALPAASLFFGREFDLYLEEVEGAVGEAGGGEGAGEELAAWRAALGDRLEAAGCGRELATLLAGWEAQCCLGPEVQRRVAARVEERMVEERRRDGGEGTGAGGDAGVGCLEMVRTPADPVVARRLVDLAAGRDVVRRCARIVAVVGRVHALSVEDELRRIAAVQEVP
ncbi:hypothetical protein PLESTB_001344600 [Pleodorina starrii]|uniref:Uncharacterized protein n=1 Tax=Pleodorina starrii TaxID=330485 RepID=A0A9W6BU77_9CHLO|nr:hypothetical protein PLESTB_001344600 [Pleodorina starrii]